MKYSTAANTTAMHLIKQRILKGIPTGVGMYEHCEFYYVTIQHQHKKKIIGKAFALEPAEALIPCCRFYDNGGESMDRYTAVYAFVPAGNHSAPYWMEGRGMSEYPRHGVGMMIEVLTGRHLGKPVDFGDLPEEVREVVLCDLDDYARILLEGGVV